MCKKLTARWSAKYTQKYVYQSEKYTHDVLRIELKTTLRVLLVCLSRTQNISNVIVLSVEMTQKICLK